MSNTIKTILRAGSALLICMLMLTPTPALAHDTLIETTPADGATVTSADDAAVSFRFSNTILETAAFIAVLDPNGEEVSLAEPVIAGDTVSRSYEPTVTGTYSASYRVTSSDGHPINGTITFVYDGPVDDTSNVPVPEPDAEAPADNDNTSNNSTMIVVLIAAGALLATLVVALVRRIRSRR